MHFQPTVFASSIYICICIFECLCDVIWQQYMMPQQLACNSITASGDWCPCATVLQATYYSRPVTASGICSRHNFVSANWDTKPHVYTQNNLFMFFYFQFKKNMFCCSYHFKRVTYCLSAGLLSQWITLVCLCALINIVMCLVFNNGHFLVIRKLPMDKN